jgi:hypothetical protein
MAALTIQRTHEHREQFADTSALKPLKLTVVGHDSTQRFNHFPSFAAAKSAGILKPISDFTYVLEFSGAHLHYW